MLYSASLTTREQYAVQSLYVYLATQIDTKACSIPNLNSSMSKMAKKQKINQALFLKRKDGGFALKESRIIRNNRKMFTIKCVTIVSREKKDRQTQIVIAFLLTSPFPYVKEYWLKNKEAHRKGRPSS